MLIGEPELDEQLPRQTDRPRIADPVQSDLCRQLVMQPGQALSPCARDAR